MAGAGAWGGGAADAGAVLGSVIHPDEEWQCAQPASEWMRRPWSWSTSTSSGARRGRRRRRDEAPAEVRRLPWEFDDEVGAGAGAGVARSTVGVRLQCELPMRLGEAVAGRRLSGTETVALTRAWTAVLAGVSDAAAAAVVAATTTDPETARRVLWVRATSWVSLTLLGKTFSNSLETIVVDALAALVLSGWGSGSGSYRRPSPHVVIAAGGLAAFGCFVRITFPAFAAPLIAFFALKAWSHHLSAHAKRSDNHPGSVFSYAPVMIETALTGLFGAVGFSLVALLCIATDSLHEGALVVAPWRNVAYNVRTENLALHGLHPRWTHALVNAPIMFGPALFVAAWHAATALPRSAFTTTLMGVVATSLAVLSAFPHQEPRFLAPMLLPLAVLAGPTMWRTLPRRALWLVFNGLSVVFWGVMHQGGVLDALALVGRDAAPTWRDKGSAPCIVGINVYLLPPFVAGEAGDEAVFLSFPAASKMDLSQCRGTWPAYVVAPRADFDALRLPAAASAKVLWSNPLHFNGETDAKFTALVVALIR